MGLWQFESSGGTSLLLTPNEVPGGAPGVLTNGAQIVYDSDRGSNVVETDGTDDYVRGGPSSGCSSRPPISPGPSGPNKILASRSTAM